MSEAIPSLWSSGSLRDVAKVVSGGTPSRYVPEFWDGGTIPWATPTDITSTTGRFLIDTRERITEKGLKSCSATLLPVGSLLLTSRATLGEIRIAGIEVCTNQGFKSLVPLEGNSGEFLYYQMLRSKDRFGSLGIGSTFLEVSKRDAERFSILVAPTNEQVRIARILAAIDETIEQTSALIGKFNKTKAGLMHDLFTRGIRPNGDIRPPREEAPHLYKESPLGWIPKEWSALLISKALITDGGIKPGPFGSSLKKSFFTSGGYRVYGQEQVIGGSLDSGNYYISRRKFEEMKAFAVAEGDVLLSLVGTIGKSLVVEKPFEAGIINPRLVRLRPNQPVCRSRFLSAYLGSDGAKRQIDALSGGGTMPVINGKVIRILCMPLGSAKEQDLAIDRMDTLDSRVAATTEELIKLNKVRIGLMRDLLTGRVRIPESMLREAVPR